MCLRLSVLVSPVEVTVWSERDEVSPDPARERCVRGTEKQRAVVMQVLKPGSLPIVGVVIMCAAAKSLQSCPTLCDPIDSSPPGSSVHGIFQARGLEWGAIAFSDHPV